MKIRERFKQDKKFWILCCAGVILSVVFFAGSLLWYSHDVRTTVGTAEQFEREMMGGGDD